MLQQFNPKNKDIQVFVKDRLVHRSEAKVSVFDSSVQGGDAVWEGLRVYPSGILCLSRHLDRLEASAKALAFADVPSRSFIKKAIRETLEANGMNDQTHIRLTLSRGEKITSGMDPRLNQSGYCLIVLAEWKPAVYDNAGGIRVMTSAIRRNNPQFLDSKIHHNNLLNNILAKIQANACGYDAALMLDHQGFAAELNGTNIFVLRQGILYTPFAHACLPGITRGFVMEIASEVGIPCREKDLSLTELYTADALFTTGTMGELTPIVDLDGRSIPLAHKVDAIQKIFKAFQSRIPAFCEQP